MRAIALVSLVVRDYDEAIEWFTGRLGFVVREDTPLDVAKITRLAVERPELYRVTPLGQVVRRATERERSAGGLALAATLLREIAPQ